MSANTTFSISADTLGDEPVAIYVGPKRKKFAVHKKLLCDRAEYFSKAFNGRFKEATEDEMYLPVDDSSAFEAFINYIYQDRLPPSPRELKRARKKNMIIPLMG